MTRWLDRAGGALLSGILHLLAALPMAWASALGAGLGRLAGRLLASRNRIARRNLAHAMPELDDAGTARILVGMWDNLGRIATESPHLHRLDVFGDPRVEIVGMEHADAAVATGKGAIFFTAHLANFEVSTLLAIQRGWPVTLVYRESNNPSVDRAIQHWRERRGGTYVTKGARGARALIAALRAGEVGAMVVDQKMNDGIAVPFFGRDAMTAPAMAEFAHRFGTLLMPVRVERLGGIRFRVTIHPPVAWERTGDRQADVLAIMTSVNAQFEDWIRARPEQWFWLHRRWPD